MGILKELKDGFKQSHGRSYYFLIQELFKRFSVDPVLREKPFGGSYMHLLILTIKANELFEANGCEKKGLQKEEKKRLFGIFLKDVERFRADDCQEMLNYLREKNNYRLILFEAFRSQTPNFDIMHDVFMKGQVILDTDQCLLDYRLQEVSFFLNKKKDLNKEDFFFEIDRMRRIRNEIVHNGASPKDINLLVSRLYKYARIYLREVIFALAKRSDQSIEEILFGRTD
jgi:hypothetical protein